MEDTPSPPVIESSVLVHKRKKESRPVSEWSTSSISELPQKWSTGITHLLRVIHMSFAFFLLYTAFSSVGNIMPSVLPDKLGFYALAVGNSVFCFSALFVTPVVARLIASKWGMTFGAFGETVFVASNLLPHWWIIIPASILMGTGSAVVWTARGSYLTLCAVHYAAERREKVRSAMGLFTGVFFCIFQCTQVVGNLMSSFFLHRKDKLEKSKSLLFWTCVGVAGLGVSLFSLLSTPPPATQLRTTSQKGKRHRNSSDEENGTGMISSVAPNKAIVSSEKGNSVLDSEEEDEEEDAEMETLLAEQQKPENPFRNVTNCIRLLKDARLALLLPAFVYSGAQASYLSGCWTSHIVKESLGAADIGYLMAVFGASDAICSFLLGKLADTKNGKKIVWVIGALAQMVFQYSHLLVLQLHDVHWFEPRQRTLYALAALYGVGDAAFNLIPNALVSTFFTHQTDLAFPHLKLCQGVGGVLFMILGAQLNFSYITLVASLLLVISTIFVVVLNLKVASIN